MAIITLIGVKHFNGEIDGQKLKSLKVTAVLPMEENENQSGSAGVEYKTKYELWEQIKPLMGKFPVEMYVEITPTAASGGRVVLQVTAIKPITPASVGK